jgi:hypothetical protein
MDFAETLMSEFEDAHSEYLGAPLDPNQAVARLTRARSDLLQALRAPKGDELTVRDRYVMAALPAIVPGTDRKLWAQYAFEVADDCMAERSRREAQP